MSSPEHVEFADLLLERASGDLDALRLLAPDEDQADHVVGFHAQQTVEKSFKAVLVVVEIEIPRTHDLAYLASLLEDADIEMPEKLATAESLTPWAGAFRYDEVAPPLDRQEVMALAATSLRWARSFVEAAR